VRQLVRPPCEALRLFVASLGCVGGVFAPSRERVLPSGAVSLMVNLHEDEFRTYDAPDAQAGSRTRGAVLAGPRSRATIIDTDEQRSLVQVEFRLGGAAPIFGVPMGETCDQLVELDVLWGPEGRVLRERLLEAPTPERRLSIVETALCARLGRGPVLDPMILPAAASLERGLRVSVVAQEVDVPPKRLVHRFQQHVGLAPKRYSRVRRLQRLLLSVVSDQPVCWAQLAAAHGFCDQAHLVNDFRELTGITPTEYRARSAAERNHVPVAAG